MSISLYELDDIRSKVRSLTGHDSQDLDDTAVDKYINRYYQLAMPLELRPYELRTWFQFDTVASTDVYDLTSQTDSVTSLTFSDYFLTLEAPVTVDGYAMTLYLSADAFYEKWPEITTYGESRPEDVLLYPQQVGAGTTYTNALLFRYPPDDAYTVKFASWRRPVALSATNTTLLVEEWGPVVAYGASREVAEDFGDTETLNKLEPLYQQHRARVNSRIHYQNVNKRAMPRW